MMIVNYKVRMKLLFFDVSVTSVLWFIKKSLHAPVVCCYYDSVLGELVTLAVSLRRYFTGTDSECFLRDAEHLFVVKLLQTSSR